jgi:hypothetical protein
MTALASTAHVAVAEAPPPGSVSFGSVDFSGSGCPSGSARATVSPDGEAFTLIFDRFYVASGPGIPAQQATRGCRVVADLRFPDGWQFSVFTVDFRGFASLEDGTSGRLHSRYRFRSGPEQRPSQVRLVGPFLDDFFKRDESGGVDRGWSPCRAGRDRDLVVDASLHVTAPAARQAYLSVDAIDSAVRPLIETYVLRWRRCS